MDLESKSLTQVIKWISSLESLSGIGMNTLESFLTYFEITDIIKLYNTVYDWEGFLNSCNRVGSYRVSNLKILVKLLKIKPYTLSDYLVAFHNPEISYRNVTSIVTYIGKDSFLSGHLEVSSLDLPLKVKNTLLLNYHRFLTLLSILLDLGVNSYFLNEDTLVKATKVCVNGNLPLSKAEFFSKFKGLVIESDVASCDYLVSDSLIASSNYNKARRLKKPIITYSEFIEGLLSESLSNV